MKQLCAAIFFAIIVIASVSSAQERASITVPEIAICSSVENKQPVGIDSVFTADVSKLYCYTGVTCQAEQGEISHVWFYQDKQMSKIDLKVKGKTFHTWSTKTILPSWKGDWRVEIHDPAGNVLAKVSFKVR